ncbi:thiamine phosphate synthase [Pseudolactococcus reticulitermitis]|nr:thiamine phosphate synthase [Lactococcus reticulitermitis]
MTKAIDYSLYLVTDSDLMSTETLEEAVEQAILGGVTLVQLREKTASSKVFLDTARRVKKVTSQYGVPLLINDRVDIALAINAEGVHIGQDDLPLADVRRLIGADKLIGVSARNLAEAQAACKAGADYLGVGAMYATDTKTDAQLVSLAELAEIRAAINLPIVVIGGINKASILDFKAMGIDGFAVVSAIMGQTEIKKAANELKGLVEKC